jgi:hypothetical protein
MFNKESCRSCGSLLEPYKICTDCREVKLWDCNNCNRKVEHIHVHKYNMIHTSNKVLTIEIIEKNK